jgi:hypothetical protein
MASQPTSTSIDRISTYLHPLAALHAPSVIAEAAGLLDAWLGVLDERGIDRRAEGPGWLAQAAAETVTAQYGRPATNRSSGELVELQHALTGAFRDEGLTIAHSVVRMGIAIEPVDGGPRWGIAGHTGLAVALYADSGWELMVNQMRTRSFTIYAPATADGAREVAALVAGIARGDVKDPFRARR